MLIALNSSDSLEARTEYARLLAEHIDGTTRIYNPHDADDYIKTVKDHNPKDNLILLESHYTLVKGSGTAAMRSVDILFDLRSGSVWGNQPAPYTAGTYMAGLDTAPEKIVATAAYNQSRSILIQKEASKSYFGRASSDPHTLIFGFKLTIPVSMHANYLVRSLPSPGPEDTVWWPGVGFAPATKTAFKAIRWFDFSNIISMGDTAHEMLEAEGVEHSAVAGMREFFKKTEKLEPDNELGLFLKELSRQGKNTDQRAWRN